MMNNSPVSDELTLIIDNIPIIVRIPNRKIHGLFLHLHALGQTKEQTKPILDRICQKGFVAISMDAWQHGERSQETQEQLFTRIFATFYKNMWPILGLTALDVSRVIDWGLAEFESTLPVNISGLSMGGDIAVTVAGLDTRISNVFAIGSTPDWKRPGMHDAMDAKKLLHPGKPDIYAQFFYNHLDPLTHLNQYEHAPQINFISGELDNHIPIDGVIQFKEKLLIKYPNVGEKVSVTVLPSRWHMDLLNIDVWWPTISELIDRIDKVE